MRTTGYPRFGSRRSAVPPWTLLLNDLECRIPQHVFELVPVAAPAQVASEAYLSAHRLGYRIPNPFIALFRGLMASAIDPAPTRKLVYEWLTRINNYAEFLVILLQNARPPYPCRRDEKFRVQIRKCDCRDLSEAAMEATDQHNSVPS